MASKLLAATTVITIAWFNATLASAVMVTWLLASNKEEAKEGGKVIWDAMRGRT